MTRILTGAFLLCIAAAGFTEMPRAQQPSPTAPPEVVAPPMPITAIGAAAIWPAAPHLLNVVKRECRGVEDGGGCLASQMAANGASPDAIGFARLVNNEGYLRDFRQVGPVSVAYVNYPLRASENEDFLLVNGEPRMVDVDDQTLWPLQTLSRDPTYNGLAKRYPKIAVFPGNRDNVQQPLVTHLSVGGQNFIVGYYLLEGCHGCAHVGTVTFGFHFDPNGKFMGTFLEDVKPISNTD